MIGRCPRPPSALPSARGEAAETLAAEHLRKQGLELIERNWRRPFGELDLVLREGQTIVFVEVRLRTHSGFGGAGASIDAAKQRRLLRAAQAWLNGRDLPCRFDVVLVSSLEPPQLEWIRDALSA